MRIYRILFLLIILSSCSTLGRYQTIRLVKVEQTETVVLEKDKSKKAPTENTNTSDLVQAETTKENMNITDLNISVSAQKDDQNVHKNSSIKKEDSEPEPEDEEENERIIEQANRAEKNAHASFFLSLAGLISLILPYIGIFPFIVGIIFYSRSNSSRYITPFGDRRLEITKTILSLDAIFLILWTILILLIIFVF